MIGMGELIVIAMILVMLPLMGFWIYALVDCVQNEVGAEGDKIAWILVIALGGVIGAVVYWFVRRPKRRMQFGR